MAGTHNSLCTFLRISVIFRRFRNVAAFVMLAVMQKIILDTDIGDDIDDALALAVILNSPELELLGVTTVFRDAALRTRLARHLLGVWERASTHVATGISPPLLQPFNMDLGTQFQLLDDVEKNGASEEHAVDFILRAARDLEARGETLTLVPIGPLTNIGVALACEPELAGRVRIVLMGGWWKADADYAEWNIACDPEAAAIVFKSGAPIDMIGLDVTLRCKLSEDNIGQIESGGTGRGALLAKLIRLWQNNQSHTPTLHDPLAVLTLFSDCVRFEEKRIEVVLCGEERGRTQIIESDAPGQRASNTRIAVDVDVERAIALFMQRVLA